MVPRANFARVKSWWVMVTVFAVAVFIYQPLSAVFLAFISYLALKEYFSLIPTRKIDRVVLLFAYLAVPVQFYLADRAQYGLFMVFIPVWMFLFCPPRWRSRARLRAICARSAR